MHATTAGPARVVLPVSGMTCAACQARVQRALSRAPGVSEAAVNLMMANATVSYDPAATSPASLVSTIRDIGYDASLPASTENVVADQEARDRAQTEEFHEYRRKAIVSGVIGAAAMVASIPLMAPDALTHAAAADPLMGTVTRWLTPALERSMPWLYAIPRAALAWSLMIATLGVMLWAGRHFYVRAWKAARHRAAT